MSVKSVEAHLGEWPAPADPVIAYAEWRMSCTAVWAAYRDWARAARGDDGVAHCAYTAALDREDAAAHVYARLVTARPI